MGVHFKMKLTMLLILPLLGLAVASPGNQKVIDPDDAVPLRRSLPEVLQEDEAPPEVIDPDSATPLRSLEMDDEMDMNFTIPMGKVDDRATSDCGCGVDRSSKHLDRIVAGGKVYPKNNRPYQVFVLSCWRSRRGSLCGRCGGTLLNKKYVLTAMHCIYSGKRGGMAQDIRVTVGTWDVEKDVSSGVAEEIQTTPIPRPDYDEKKIDNDIALLRLRKEVAFNDRVIPACLPTDANKKYEGVQAAISGFGAIYEGGPSSDQMKESSVTIVAQSHSTCRQYGNLPMTKLCAYGSSTDTCQGDSGGPLVVQEDGRNTVVGVVSYGNGCARRGVAGVYARVTTYLKWIHENMKGGWCGGSGGGFKPATTTTRRPSNGLCDLSCYIGRRSGRVTVNGLPLLCSRGMCKIRWGSLDVCQYFRNPCSPY